MAICIFGDSVAKGIIYDEVRNKYVRFKDCFADVYAKKNDLDLTNYARFGCTAAKGAELLNRHKDKLHLFSHTVLEFGGNDCDHDWPAISESPENRHSPKVPLQQFEETYLKMIDIIKSAGSIPVVLSLPPLDPERFFKWVSTGLNRENILSFLGDVDLIYRWHESYDATLKKLAKLHSVCLIDIRSAFLNESCYSDFLCRDGMHPNEKGHALISRCMI